MNSQDGSACSEKRKLSSLQWLSKVVNTEKVLGICFLFFPVFLAVLIIGYPVVSLFRLAFSETKFFEIIGYAGFRNFKYFLQDSDMVRNIINTFIYAIGSVGTAILVGGSAAVILNGDIPLARIIRIFLTLPWVVAPIAAALLWRWLLNDPLGPIINIIRAFGFPIETILLNPVSAMTCIVLAGAWRSFPFPMLMIYAKLRSIPIELYEAAKIDGASRWQILRSIEIPLIADIIIVCAIMLSIRYINEIDIIYVLTGGGPGVTTETLSLRLYRMAFESWNFGRSAVLSIFLLIINVIFALVYISVYKKEHM